MAALLARDQRRRRRPPGAPGLACMATFNSALASAWTNIGSIEPGKAADLCAVDASGGHRQAAVFRSDLPPRLCGRPEDVSHVWVDGKCCVSSNKLYAAGKMI